MKISRAEWIILAVAGLFLAFCVGYFLAGRSSAEPYTVAVQRQEATPSPSPGDTDAGTAATPTPTATGPIDLNTATAEELQSLPGIGAQRAADIVAYREAHGPFSMVEEITSVPGIGEGILAEIIDLVTVSGGDRTEGGQGNGE